MTAKGTVVWWWMRAGVCLAFLSPATLEAQSALRGWGRIAYSTEARDGTFVQVTAGTYGSLVRRADGLIFGHGEGTAGGIVAPMPPPGLVYTDVAAGEEFSVGLLSDGTLLAWGRVSAANPLVPFPQPPPAPPGTHYLDVEAGQVHAVALRSDGVAVAWSDPLYCASPNFYGMCSVPSMPAPVAKVVAGGMFNLALLTDGTIVAWGQNTVGQLQVPPLPTGLTYVDIGAGAGHGLALRSDGVVAGWGGSFYGQTVVPPLPPGLTYTAVCSTSLGYFSLLLRSDGGLVAFGDNSFGQCNVPTLPPGVTFVQAAGGNLHTIALLSNGQVIGWGDNLMTQSFVSGTPANTRWTGVAQGVYHALGLLSDGTLRGWGYNDYGQGDAPTLPTGMRYLQASAGYTHSAAIRSDGALIAWGDNNYGQTSVPPLPTGVTYTNVSASPSPAYTAALRSDGMAVAFGQNTGGVLNIPTPPPGVTYTQVVAFARTGLLRSDGQIVIVGTDYATGVLNVPQPPQGLVYTELALRASAATALRSDGEIVTWGTNPMYPGQWMPQPPLPSGVVYVEIGGGVTHTAARRSDGQVIVTGLGYTQDNPWELLPGTSYVEISANWQSTSGRVGPTSTYVAFAQGCPGSMQRTRLVPRDTPRIDKVHEVTLFDLPASAAFMLFGWSRTAPLSLSQYGMPGCSAHVSPDGAYFVAGQNHQAKYRLSIPNLPGLVGLHFFNQAIVFDPAAGNPLGAVMSDAAEGVVGHW